MHLALMFIAADTTQSTDLQQLLLVYYVLYRITEMIILLRKQRPRNKPDHFLLISEELLSLMIQID